MTHAGRPRSESLGSTIPRHYFSIAVMVMVPGTVILAWFKPDVGFAFGTILAGLSPTLLAIYEKETRTSRAAFAVLDRASAHARASGEASGPEVLHAIQRLLKEEAGVDHLTVQLERGSEVICEFSRGHGDVPGH
jgi:hypothetical protein